MIILEDNQGNQLKVSDGERYDGRKWHVVGSEPSLPTPEETDAHEIIRLIASELEIEGIQWGSVLKVLFKPVALMLGKSHCLSCDVREAIINSTSMLIKKFGKQQAALHMKQLIKDSFILEPLKVMQELKEILS